MPLAYISHIQNDLTLSMSCTWSSYKHTLLGSSKSTLLVSPPIAMNFESDWQFKNYQAWLFYTGVKCCFHIIESTKVYTFNKSKNVDTSDVCCLVCNCLMLILDHYILHDIEWKLICLSIISSYIFVETFHNILLPFAS